ncbi:MAG: hypothetical protein PVF29_17745 [Desulfobacterales bacterium]|jgi:hypothetical protein
MVDIDYIKELQAKKESAKQTIRRAAFDRRSGEDKRILYNLDYFIDGGKERRDGKERRQIGERRSGWARVYKWCSVFLGKKAS